MSSIYLKYSKGDKFYCEMEIDISGSLKFYKIHVPRNTKQYLRKAFLEEAEVEALIYVDNLYEQMKGSEYEDRQYQY